MILQFDYQIIVLILIKILKDWTRDYDKKILCDLINEKPHPDLWKPIKKEKNLIIYKKKVIK